MAAPTLRMKKRLNIYVTIAIILAFSIVAVHLIDISVFHYNFYNHYADSHQLRPETIPANRGSIYDCNMQVLAQSATVWDVVLNPQEISEDEAPRVAAGLSKLLGVDEEKILKKTKAHNQYEIVKRKVEKDVYDKVNAFILSENKYIADHAKKGADVKYLTGAINLVENTKRYYPNSTLAAPVLGFTGTDSQGLYGLEEEYDSTLAGTPGYVVSLKNALSENIPNSMEEKYDPIDGNSLVLTIDETIQHFVEKTLTQVVAQHNPKKGACAIVMNVNTGAVLAMADTNKFDCNQPFTVYNPSERARIAGLPADSQQSETTKALAAQWNNKAISYAMQPGSTFKLVTASAALEEKTESLKSTFYCPGFIRVEDRIINCHKRSGHGHLDFTGAVVNSCNPSFVQIGLKLGPNRFFKYVKGYGMTEHTGIDLPGEGNSVYYDANGLRSKVSLASCSFGQSIAVTPLQLITMASAVTNGGYLMKPYLVKDVLDSGGNVIQTTKPTIKRQVISEETSKIMRSIMEQVVVAKGGTNAAVKGYRIGGKSGTSQKQNPGDDKNARIASYVAVAPIDNPQIAVYVMIDEPQSGDIYGSVVAAPAVASIMADTLPYLGYSPKYSEAEAKKLDVTVPMVTGTGVLEAQSKLAAAGLGTPQIVGSGKNVVKQSPGIGTAVPREGTVFLYTDQSAEKTVTVPSVIGLPTSAAKQRLSRLELNVSTKGAAGKVTLQSVGAGKKVPLGTVVEITSVQGDTD